jgi:pilus assembly protein Flp/PilA
MHSHGQEISRMQNITLRIFVKIQSLKDGLANLVNDENGQDIVEYAVVVALIAMAATATMKTFATTIATAFTSVGNKLTTYTS